MMRDMGSVYYCSCDQQASQIDSKYCVLFVRLRHDYDKACHKCIPDETQLPIQEHLSWSTAMYLCQRWFRNRAVHKCYGNHHTV